MHIQKILPERLKKIYPATHLGLEITAALLLKLLLLVALWWLCFANQKQLLDVTGVSQKILSQPTLTPYDKETGYGHE